MLAGAVVLATLALSACGTPAAKDFRGSWKPVNRFQDAPVEIPLEQPYTFYAAPMDETLEGRVSASIGLAHGRPSCAEDAEALLVEADQEMLALKTSR